MKPKTDLAAFIDTLNANKKNIIRQQYRTIKGHAFAWDIWGAEEGLYKLLDRRCG